MQTIKAAGVRQPGVRQVEAAFRGIAAEFKDEDQDAAETLLALTDLLAGNSR